MITKGLWARCPRTGYFGNLIFDRRHGWGIAEHDLGTIIYTRFQNDFNDIDWPNLEIFTYCEE